MTATIRLATEADAGAISAIYAPIVEETHVSFEVTPPTTEEMEGRIRDTKKQYPWLVCEIDDQVVGYAYASRHNDRAAYRWGVDTSVYVDDAWHRRGIARGLYESLFALLRLQGLYRAYAIIVLPNPPSVEFHEEFGFERVGVYRDAGFKNGEWHDVGHWQLSLQPVERPPSPPTPFDDLDRSDRWNRAIETGEARIRS